MIAEQLKGPAVQWFALTPMLILLGGGLALLVLASLTPKWPRGLYAAFSAATSAAAIVLAILLWRRVTVHGPEQLVGGAMVIDHYALFVTIVIAGGALLTSLVTDDYLHRERLEGPEMHGLYLMSAIGGIVMASANDLIVLFLGLEVLSIAFYVLAAGHRRRIKSQEAGIKYFVLGGFSSAFFLYGIALIYGGSGSTNYTKILSSFAANVSLDRKDAFVLAGVALLVVGLAFKASAVPFQFWTPDVYEGAPTPVTAYFASVGKVAAFAAMVRVLVFVLPNWSDDWRPVIWIIGVLTLVVGSVLAVVQTNVKRMLAYSSISHAGFVLVGLEAAAHKIGAAKPTSGVSSVLLYLVLYVVMVLGTFGVVALVSRTGDGNTDLAGFRGLGRTRPALALGMTVLLLAQAGVPLTSGFVAKFGVLKAAAEAHSYAIAIIAMVSAVIAAFLYLRIMISLWITPEEPADETREAVALPWGTTVAITLSVLFTVALGVAPGWLITITQHATTIFQFKRAAAGK